MRVCANCVFCFLAIIAPVFVYAEEIDLKTALQRTYVACVGIDESLSELKKMAGVSTAVGAVGAGLGVGAMAVGIAKAGVDEEAEEIEIRIENLRKIAETGEKCGPKTEAEIELAWGNISDAELMNGMIQRLSAQSEGGTEDVSDDEKRLEELTNKSINLGNWRTGLSAAATVTSITGAIVSGVAGAKSDVEEMVAKCNEEVSNLSAVAAQARLNGEDTEEAQLIVNACNDYELVDAEKIAKMARGAMVSSIAGVATGVTGTVLSAVANSESVRDNNEGDGRKKEKNLNAASNVLTAGTAVANVASTVFSAVQIAELKKMATVSEKCSYALK